MDPLTLGMAAVGIGLQIFGGSKSASNAKAIAAQNQRIAADEQAINEQKRQQMELEAQRKQVENLRNAQRLRAQATAAATTQGAGMGSGLAGGLAQITGMQNWNSLNLGQNLAIGENIFNTNNDISGARAQLATLQGQQATNQGLMSLGGALVSNSETIGKFFGGSSGFGGGQTMTNPYSSMPQAGRDF